MQYDVNQLATNQRQLYRALFMRQAQNRTIPPLVLLKECVNECMELGIIEHPNPERDVLVYNVAVAEVDVIWFSMVRNATEEGNDERL